MFDHIINWELKSGSHDFPGPQGGTCINEAAIVAAGFTYKKIGSAHDCPPCFSRPIAAYAIRLNDSMPDGLRNELLMPFVTRLAGTADTREVEQQRAAYMAIETVRQILPVVLRLRNREDLALICEGVRTLAEARQAADRARAAAAYAYDYDAAAAAAYAYDYDAAAAAAYAYDAAADTAAYAYDAADTAAYAYDADAAAAYDAAYAADAAAAAAYAAADADTAARRQIWTLAVGILDGAIRLGKTGDVLAVEVAVERLNKAMELAR